MDKINKSGIGDQIKILWDEGYSADKISQLTGKVVTGKSVLRFLNRNGINTGVTEKVAICENCSKEFTKKRSFFLKSGKHFCCMPCYWGHLKNSNYKRSVYGNRLARRVVRECQHFFSPGEVVHHIDKNGRNNAIENLLLYGSNGRHLSEELTKQPSEC